MIVFHGTTTQRARRICREGFLPKPPSRRVWFAENRPYAYHRARTQARRTRDRAIVLTADLDLPGLRRRLGPGRVLHKNRVIAIDAIVPVSVLRWHPDVDLSATPREVAEWINDVLGLDPPHGAHSRHPGVRRLARWIDHQIGSERRAELRWSAILDKARRWLPELFVGVDVPVERVQASPIVGTVHVDVQTGPRRDPRVAKALALLTDPRARPRVRGLTLLARLGEPDLFDWCVMFLGDESVEVRLAALRGLLSCEDGHAEIVQPLAHSDNKRIRAAAIAALAHLAGDQAPRWFRRGLKDPCPCVRIATARLLDSLDPAGHEAIFSLALADPNPDVVRAARRRLAATGHAAHAWPATR